ncbi:MAG: hypothetical protein KDK34_16960, partial [Leptospiraceae bacterium]|nr:hypothetical protein [Leptospiraceae bacterium]
MNVFVRSILSDFRVWLVQNRYPLLILFLSALISDWFFYSQLDFGRPATARRDSGHFVFLEWKGGFISLIQLLIIYYNEHNLLLIGGLIELIRKIGPVLLCTNLFSILRLNTRVQWRRFWYFYPIISVISIILFILTLVAIPSGYKYRVEIYLLFDISALPVYIFWFGILCYWIKFTLNRTSLSIEECVDYVRGNYMRLFIIVIIVEVFFYLPEILLWLYVDIVGLS